jgi:hypothetical protein
MQDETYTKEDAERDAAECHRIANNYEAAGDPFTAGIMRVEAANCMNRVGMSPVKPNPLGARRECT